MCELFSMSSRVPSTVSLSLEEFSSHGGLHGPHKDGWGIAWYEDGDIHLTKESLSASSSAGLHHVVNHPFQSDLVLCHIRKATQGAVASRNCQPFVREMGGKWHSFAHNGDLSGIRESCPLLEKRFMPIGETDSEWAFCVLLETLAPLWSAEFAPGLDARLIAIKRFAERMRALGPANFLYSDGEFLFVHSHKRHQSDGTIGSPGLWRLQRHCHEGGTFDATGLTVTARGIAQDVVLVASVPLTDENWIAITEGHTVAIRNGQFSEPHGEHTLA